ncbi:prolyl-tRNA synthetase associated domain-containing protein [Chitinophaga pinensis]|uniref:Prolyl-tRNA synthetase associated domain-containing protein n=1 Tax=Chitinophaga pinensis TaxID=79329 RepID=A0A5C6LKK5_9BACT|nr:YbaK/EbsC family protein [Chitinophaga pinensis]TWV90763.1 prolyl-tRNA synthetase associated domain-containing protein [Chitinophaga pinensis]
MINVSEVMKTAPAEFKTPLQQLVYTTLEQLDIGFERVENDEAITMEDCIQINERLQMKTVKTLFLCNRQQTNFYLFVTTADKPFVTKDLSSALGISRVSFAPADLLLSMLGTAVGATTIFGVLLDTENKVQLVIDSDVLKEEWYGCSDGTTTSYMKIDTQWVVNSFPEYARHPAKIIQI